MLAGQKSENISSQKRVNHELMRIVKSWGQILGFDSEKYIYQDERNGLVNKNDSPNPGNLNHFVQLKSRNRETVAPASTYQDSES